MSPSRYLFSKRNSHRTVSKADRPIPGCIIADSGLALLLENYIDPGAGLKPLADIWRDSDAIYDNLFQDAMMNTARDIKIPMVRTYGGNDRAM